MKVSGARRLRHLEDENRKLKQLLGEATLDNQSLKELLSKTGDACGAAWRLGRSHSGIGAKREARLQAGKDPPVGGQV